MKFLENSKNFIDENTVFLTCFQKKKQVKNNSKNFSRNSWKIQEFKGFDWIYHQLLSLILN